MPKINKTKLLEYRQVQKNPALVIFKSIQDFHQQINQITQEAKDKLKEIADQCQKDLEARLQKEVEGIKMFLSAETEKAVKENIFKGIVQIKGEKGDKGDSIEGDKGDVGLQGKQGLQGITGTQGAKGERGLTGKSGKDGISGKSPIKGIDYWTKDEIKDVVSMVVGLIKLKPIEEKLKELIKKIDQMEKVRELGARRTLHRGGIDFVWNEAVGEGDVAGTTSFDLDYMPYSTSELTVYVGGGIMFLTDDFTLSGKTLTFLTSPPVGAKIRATYRK